MAKLTGKHSICIKKLFYRLFAGKVNPDFIGNFTENASRPSIFKILFWSKFFIKPWIPSYKSVGQIFFFGICSFSMIIPSLAISIKLSKVTGKKHFYRLLSEPKSKFYFSFVTLDSWDYFLIVWNLKYGYLANKYQESMVKLIKSWILTSILPKMDKMINIMWTKHASRIRMRYLSRAKQELSFDIHIATKKIFFWEINSEKFH